MSKRLTDNQLWRTLFLQMAEGGGFEKSFSEAITIDIEGTAFSLHWRCSGEMEFVRTSKDPLAIQNASNGEAKIVFSWHEPGSSDAE